MSEIARERQSRARRTHRSSGQMQNGRGGERAKISRNQAFSSTKRGTSSANGRAAAAARANAFSRCAPEYGGLVTSAANDREPLTELGQLRDRSSIHTKPSTPARSPRGLTAYEREREVRRPARRSNDSRVARTTRSCAKTRISRKLNFLKKVTD